MSIVDILSDHFCKKIDSLEVTEHLIPHPKISFDSFSIPTFNKYKKKLATPKKKWRDAREAGTKNCSMS